MVAKPRYLAWLLLMVLILGFGWFKNAENERERQECGAYQERFRALRQLSKIHYGELTSWAKDLLKNQNPAKEIAEKLFDGDMPPFEKKQDEEVIRWVSPEEGLNFEFTFRQSRYCGFVSHCDYGPTGEAWTPPPNFAHVGRAESIRRTLIPCLVFGWIAALVVFWFLSEFRQLATEAMLVLAIACGTTLMVSPFYSLTWHGIFSNDQLAYAAGMFLCSFVFLGQQFAETHGPEMKFQYSLRTMFVVMTAVAILMAIGRVGYVAIPVFIFGAVIFWISAQRRIAYLARFEKHSEALALQNQFR
jgi:hypothetical protein